ncbi:MAG: hypothetical protein WD971_06280 [Pirellulales bacterium]
MIKPDRDAARPQKYGYAIANDHRLRMIDLKTVAARQLDGEWMKRRSLAQGVKKLSKVLGCHD